MQFSIRTKLITGFLLVIVIGSLISSYIGSKIIGNVLIEQVQRKVYHDLETAWLIYDEKLASIEEIITFTSKREGILDLLVRNDRAKLLQYLNKVKTDNNLSLLTLTDHLGKVIVRVNNPDRTGDDLSEDPLVQRALHREIAASTEIMPHDHLQRECESLADQSFMQIIPTPKSISGNAKENSDGMLLITAAPIVDRDNAVRGVLYGGVLLNRDYEIVDKVKDVVYRGEKYKDKDTGTATIFQGDLRIATNVLDERGERAVGTRVSQEVSRSVLEEGNPWTGRAFVVNDWYITAYGPIRNISGNIIGMLYVGTLEAPYLALVKRIQLTFLGIALLSILISAVIAFFLTKNIIRPLREMALATRKIARGDLDQRIEVQSKDEIGHLADSFNQMTLALSKAQHELLLWGRTLEEKVREKSRELEAAQAQLIQSEKLATIGRLSAGIAHELNNPLGGIVVYSHLLLESPDIEGRNRENLEKTVREATRCQNIVKGLLDFSRQTKPELGSADINEILKNTLALVEKQAQFQNIEVVRSFDGTLPAVKIDAMQIQQAFINIIVNALEAMDENGTLSVTTRLSKENDYIEIEVTDTGCGISSEDLAKVFEPFFTTKPVGKGTGLGLAISYGIVRRHRGIIEVQSEIGRGTTFTIKLPVRPQE